jgi:uncharacterized membrane protein
LLIFFLNKNVFESEISWVAFCLATSSPFLIHYSSELRSYGLLVAFSCLSSQAIIKTIKFAKIENESILISLLALQSFTHLCGAFLSLTQLILLKTELPSVSLSRKKFLKFYLIIFSPVIIWYFLSFLYQKVRGVKPMDDRTEWMQETIWVQQIFDFFRLMFFDHRTESSIAIILGIALLIFSLPFVFDSLDIKAERSIRSQYYRNYFMYLNESSMQLMSYISKKEVLILIKIILGYVLIFLILLPYKNLIIWRNFAPIAPSVIYLTSFLLISFIKNRLFLYLLFLSVLIYYCFNFPYVRNCCAIVKDWHIRL